MKIKRVLPVFLLCFITQYLSAQGPGGTIVRLEEEGGISRCINRNNDAIQIGFVGMKIDKKKNWFKQQSQAGVKVGVRVEGMDSNFETKATEFTQIFVVDVEEYNAGSILLPIEGSIMRFFPLNNKGTFFNGIDLSITLMNKKNNTNFGVVVNELANMTKQYAFPTTPFEPGIKMLANFTSNLMSPANDDENNISRIPISTINLPFSPYGNCNSSSFQEKTGVFSVIFGSDSTTDSGYVDINNTSEYKFKLQTEPSRAILVCKKRSNGNCTNYVPLKNDFLMFYINAFPISPTSSTATLKLASNYDRSVLNDSLKVNLMNSDWFKSADEEFRSDILKASDESLKINKPSKNMDHSTTELSNRELLIIDYLEASRRLSNLGLSKEIDSLPNIPVKILEMK